MAPGWLKMVFPATGKDFKKCSLTEYSIKQKFYIPDLRHNFYKQPASGNSGSNDENLGKGQERRQKKCPAVEAGHRGG
jgi:hypothetical protein